MHVTDPLRSPLDRVIHGLGSPFLDPRTRQRYSEAALAAERALVGTAQMAGKPMTATHEQFVDAIRALLDVPPPARADYQLVGRYVCQLQAEWDQLTRNGGLPGTHGHPGV